MRVFKTLLTLAALALVGGPALAGDKTESGFVNKVFKGKDRDAKYMLSLCRTITRATRPTRSSCSCTAPASAATTARPRSSGIGGAIKKTARRRSRSS